MGSMWNSMDLGPQNPKIPWLPLAIDVSWHGGPAIRTIGPAPFKRESSSLRGAHGWPYLVLRVSHTSLTYSTGVPL
jgi:hypothetical protein